MTGDQIQVGNIQESKAIAIGRGATAIYQGLTVAEVAALVVKLKSKDQPVVWNGRIPYIGLSAFQESDAQYFFGRQSLVDDLLERVQKASFIVIAGPSGSGKSSVARAGLFHALRNGHPRQRFVLLVDQFEETFTQTKDEAVQVAFIEGCR